MINADEVQPLSSAFAVLEGGTDAASMLIFDPGALPDDYDERMRPDPLAAIEPLAGNGNLYWLNTDSDGGYSLGVCLDGRLPGELSRFAKPLGVAGRFAAPSGRLFFTGIEYAFRHDDRLLRRYPHMGACQPIPSGVYQLALYEMDYPEGFPEGLLRERLPANALRLYTLLNDWLIPLICIGVLLLFVSLLGLGARVWSITALPAGLALVLPVVLLSRTPTYRQARGLLLDLQRRYPDYIVTVVTADDEAGTSHWVSSHARVASATARLPSRMPRLPAGRQKPGKLLMSNGVIRYNSDQVGVFSMTQNHLTEAACLVENGAQYSRRVGLQHSTADPEPIFAGFRAGAFSLFFADSPFYHFDLDGRLQRAVDEGTHFVKGLDGSVQVVERVREGQNLVLRRHILTDAEADDFDEQVRSRVCDLMARLDAGRLERVEPPAAKATPLAQDDLHEFLERIIGWNSAAWVAQRARYLAAYGSAPLPFLPPECQNAVLLEATRGHAGGAAFGGRAASEPYVRPCDEFGHHAALVAGLWGRRLAQSRFVFLAGSDVLRQPVECVAAYLEVIKGAFPIATAVSPEDARPATSEQAGHQLEGVQAFLDDFRPGIPDRSGWNELQGCGLVRVSLGIESGDSEVRALYGKHYSQGDVAAAIRDIKSAGIGVSLLTLVGAGGVERAAAHVSETARLFEALAVGPGDFVFLLDEREIRDPCRDVDDLALLDHRAWLTEQARLKEALAPLKKRGVKVLPYTLEKQRA
jgi:hypothetical protein